MRYIHTYIHTCIGLSLPRVAPVRRCDHEHGEDSDRGEDGLEAHHGLEDAFASERDHGRGHVSAVRF